MSKRYIRTAIVAAAAVLSATFGVGATAHAAGPVNPPALSSARQATAAVAPNSVYSASIVDGQVGQSDMYNPLVQYLLRVPTNGVFNSSINNGVVSLSKLAPDVKASLAKGTAQSASLPAPVVVTDIGGSIYDPAAGQGATEVAFSNIVLQPGQRYRIDYTAQAGWKSGATPVADTQVQLVPWLNVDADDVFKASTAAQQNDEILKAVSATAYLPAKANRHITVSGSVTYLNDTGVAQPLQLGAFGYQDNQGGDASGLVVIQAANLSATLL